MKKYLVSALLIMTTVAAFAAPHTYTAPTKPKRTTKSAVKKKPSPPPIQTEEVRGVLPRAFAHGNNPIQMLNPKAPPAQYGTSAEHVAYDPYTGKPMGIKLFEFVF